MLKITCYNCHASWALNREATQAALDALEPGADYYSVECPQCRRLNKVAIKQMRRSLPRRPEADTPPESEEPEETESA